jgi:hypothetical protein
MFRSHFIFNTHHHHHHHYYYFFLFKAQISFHNCHIPFIGSVTARKKCARGETCRTPSNGEAPYTDEELDYYACLVELDNAVGIILKALKTHGYYDNTMVRFYSRLDSIRHIQYQRHSFKRILNVTTLSHFSIFSSIFHLAILIHCMTRMHLYHKTSHQQDMVL